MTLSPKYVFRSWFVAGAVVAVLLASPPGASSAEPSQQAPMGDEIPLTIGKSIVLDIPDEIQRVALTNDAVADAIAISTREVLINAKDEGVTTLVLWSRSGDRTFFTISVAPNIRMVQDHVRATFPGEQVRITSNLGVMTLNGKVSDPAVEERIISLLQGMGAGTVVSNLELPIPAADRQILLRVKFLEVQRNAIRDFGVSLFSTGAGGTIGAIGTQQFGGVAPPAVGGTIGGSLTGTNSSFSITDTLNVFAFRPDLNIGGLLKLLQSRGLSELLAEPNVLATSGKQADLLVGGEFPVPVIQGGSSAGAVTVQFREFGIRIAFLPQFTPRGSIQMHVKPEVSALDYANALQLSGFLIPALATRRVETDVELMPGQSFVIGGLLDQRLVESINRIPGLSKIPLLGELFKSRTKTQNNTELLVIVTPEFPDLIDAGEPHPELTMPRDFLPPISDDPEYQEKK